MDEKIILGKPTEVELTKINIVGKSFFNVFEDKSGNIIEVEITEKEHSELEKNKPTKEGCVWLHSTSGFKYDTPSGKMEDGCYADNGGDYRVMINGVNKNCVKRSDIVAGKISQSKIDSIVAESDKFKNLI